jgi:hypothetical protein
MIFPQLSTMLSFGKPLMTKELLTCSGLTIYV